METASVKKEEQVKRAEELNNSQQLDVHKWSEYPEVNKAVNSIYEEFKALPEFTGKQNIQKKHIKVIVLDLYVKHLADPSRYTSYYRMKGKYKGANRYNKLHISFTSVSVIDQLETLGYLENHKGHYDKTGKRPSHMARMRATEKLTNLIVKDHSITPGMIKKHPNTECIILRNKEKQDIEYEDTKDTKRMRSELYSYNNLLRISHIDIPWFPKEGVGSKPTKIDRHDKFVRRIFNNSSWDQGGRYYGGWWQKLPKEWRKEILIDGEKVIEIDYSGLHIVLLYALEGIDYWKDIKTDPYQLSGYETSKRMRGLLKQVLLTSVNAESKTAALKGVRYEISKNKEKYGWVLDEGIDLNELIENFSSTHSPIAKYFFSGFGVKLQNLDSRIAELVIEEFTARNIPILCIHDSFMVPEQYKELLHGRMEWSFMMALHESKGAVITTPKVDEILHATSITLCEPDDMEFKDVTGDSDRNPSVMMTLRGYTGEEYYKSLMDHKDKEWDKEYFRDNK